MKEFLKLYFEIVIAIVLGLILGFVLDIIFRFPSANESPWKSLGWVILQILVGALIIMLVVMLLHRFKIFRFDVRVGVIAFTVFTMIFFTAQIQMYQRIDLLARHMMDRLSGATDPIVNDVEDHCVE